MVLLESLQMAQGPCQVSMGTTEAQGRSLGGALTFPLHALPALLASYQSQLAFQLSAVRVLPRLGVQER